MEELKDNIEMVVNGLREYSDGNNDYQELFDTVVNALDEFKKDQISNEMTTRLIFLISKITTILKCPGLVLKEDYQVTESCIKEDFKYYRYVSSIFNKYLKKCHKDHVFYDIDMWYLLYLNLSFLLNEITNYTHYIRLLELSYMRGYTFEETPRSQSLVERKDTIEEILKLLQVKKED